MLGDWSHGQAALINTSRSAAVTDFLTATGTLLQARLGVPFTDTIEDLHRHRHGPVLAVIAVDTDRGHLTPTGRRGLEEHADHLNDVAVIAITASGPAEVDAELPYDLYLNHNLICPAVLTPHSTDDQVLHAAHTTAAATLTRRLQPR